MIEINGRTLIMYQNYTFSKKGSANNFYCSKKQVTSCAAKLNFDKEMVLRQVYSWHNHPPPKLYKTPSGKYIKVNWEDVRVAAGVNVFFLFKMYFSNFLQPAVPLNVKMIRERSGKDRLLPILFFHAFAFKWGGTSWLQEKRLWSSLVLPDRSTKHRCRF